jgi:hypothetical protein
MLFWTLLQKRVLCTFTNVVLDAFTKACLVHFYKSALQKCMYTIMSCGLEYGVKQNGGSVPFLKERSFREVQKGGKSKKAKSKKTKSKKAKRPRRKYTQHL